MLDQLEHHFILFSTVFLLIGYLLGTHFRNTKNKDDDKIESFFDKQKKRTQVDNKTKKSTIDIDDSTHVVKIKTDGLEKKYEEIGNKQTTKEDISSSVNKLKNLKK